jgi:UTP--glucose-1-phosphate uridylyltransferase
MNTGTALRSLRPFLQEALLGPQALRAFERMYRAYRGGESGKIPWGEVVPGRAEDLVSLTSLESGPTAALGEACLDRVVWIVLNGGLGTSMRMDRAKSLLSVRSGLSFLDLISRHALDLRNRWGRSLPLLFMNSFATREDTLAALAPYALAVACDAGPPLPLDFVQHRFPRIAEDTGLPVSGPEDPETWAPPGHGDLYLALRESGVLASLLRAGYRWAFVSNSDNLGASVHPGILGLMAAEGLEFAMEVTRKTEADVKGGALVRRGGRWELLELAQVPEANRHEFENVTTFPVFNTNNLWFDLEAVERRLASEDLFLPLIVNRKVVGGTAVVQLETAMGAAVGCFPKSAGILVPRTRFAPVKTTDDLLARRSDAYCLGETAPLVPNPERPDELGPPTVRLDPRYYGSVPDLDFRIPEAPSLVRAKSLEVIGDVRFGRGVVVDGKVRLENGAAAPLSLADGAQLRA